MYVVDGATNLSIANKALLHNKLKENVAFTCTCISWPETKKLTEQIEHKIKPKMLYQ